MIEIIDNFLEPGDLAFYLEYCKKAVNSHTIIQDSELTEKFWSKYAHRLQQFSGLYPYVTINRNIHPIKRHRDRRNEENENYKILVYLNDVPNGGTIFYLPDGSIRTVENKTNRLVCFDITLEHESQRFSSVIKYSVGFRPISPSVAKSV